MLTESAPGQVPNGYEADSPNTSALRPRRRWRSIPRVAVPGRRFASDVRRRHFRRPITGTHRTAAECSARRATPKFGLMQSLHAAGFPVAECGGSSRRARCSASLLRHGLHRGRPVSATSQPSTRPRPQRLFGASRALHALQPTAHLPAVDPAQSTHILIEHWRNVGKSTGAPRVPLLDSAEMWLHQNAPIDQSRLAGPR